MTDVTIACPTFNRAGKVKTFTALGSDLLLVPPLHQAQLYRAAYPEARVDPHPDELKGLPPVRQWMYEKYGDLFMVDDDVPQMFDYTQERTRRLNPPEAKTVIHRIADQAEQMGAFLWGPSNERNPLRFQPQRPFRLTGVVRGRCMGLLAGAKFFFPQEISADDEMCVSGLNAYFHRFCLVDERYAMPGDEYTPGGLASRRSSHTLTRWVEKLQEMFGEAITAQKLGDAKLTVPW
jgi:hypothetical protein